MTIKHNQTIDIEVGYVYSKILSVLPKIIKNKIEDALSFYVEGYQFSPLFKNGFFDKKSGSWKYWDGKKHLFYGGSSFNTGLLDKVIEIIKSSGPSVSVIDKRIKPAQLKKSIIPANFESREYQDRALQAALQKNTSIIKCATGGGKSIVMARLIAARNVKTMVFVPSLDLLYQTKSMIEKVIGREIGIIGDGLVNIRDINISTIWSAANALSKKLIAFDEEAFGNKKEKFKSEDKQRVADAIKNTDMILIDECHQTSCASLQIINSAAKKCYFKHGFSGTPQRFSGEDLLIEGVLGRKIIDIPASELIDGGFLVRPTIHFISIPESNEDLGNSYQSLYKKYIVENEIRNEKIVQIASKLKDAGRKILILVKNIKHGEELMEKFDSKTVVYFVRGELSSDERNHIKDEFIKDKIDIIVASAVYDQGIDICNLDALILAGSGKSPGRALQRIGRVIRPSPNKKDAIVIDFLDNAKYLYRHSLARKCIYETEDGFVIKMPKDFDQNASEPTKIKKKTKKQDYVGW